MLVAAFNDIGMVESLIEEQKDELAGVIVDVPAPDPAQSKPLQALRAVTTRHGIPPIFDEVVTGFRFALGGRRNITASPDLCNFLGQDRGGFALPPSPAAPTS